jgi:hypothetical protein
MRGGQVVVCFTMCLFLSVSGCGGKPLPQLTEVQGVVLIDGEPLPRAQIQFVPELTSFGSDFNSRAITDDEGKFRLVCRKTGEPGAVLGVNRVVVSEHTPPELRGSSAEAQLKFAEYVEELKNRPIPEVYGSVGKTPLKIDVTAAQKEYTIFLARPKVDW